MNTSFKELIKLSFFALMVLVFSQCVDKEPPVFVPPIKTNDTTKVVNVDPTGTIEVEVSNLKQKVELIGAGNYFYSGHIKALTNRNEAMNWLYKDLNVNVYKIVFRFGNLEDVNDNDDPNVTDFSKFNFSKIGNKVDQLEMLKLAKAVNPNLKIYAIVLSPPKFLKTNNDVNRGGTLNANYPKAYEEFGESIYANIKYLKDKGFDLDYLALMNEPDFASAVIDYESAEFTPAQANNAYVNTSKWLNAKLSAEGLKVPKYVGPELINVTNTSRYYSAMNASNVIDLYSAHHYSQSSISNFSSASNLVGNKGIIMSEWHTGHGLGGTPNESNAMLDLVTKFHHAFKGGSRGWLYFEWGNPVGNFGGLIFTPWSENAVRRKNYYIFQQYMNGIIGSNYVPTTVTSGMAFANDQVSAFVTPSSLQINILNLSSTDQKAVKINIGKVAKGYTINRTSDTENNAFIKNSSTLNANNVVVDIAARSLTTIQFNF